MDYINSPGAAATSAIAGGGVAGCSLMPCAITVKGLPFVKPPWGRITAIDLNKGEMVWQIPHGETLDAVTNHPMMKGRHDSANRPDRTDWHADDEDAGHFGRARVHDAAVGSAGREAVRVRQGDRKRTGECVHAGAADGQPDELHAQRQAVSRPRDQRPGFSGRADCLYGGAVAVSSSRFNLWVYARVSVVRSAPLNLSTRRDATRPILEFARTRANTGRGHRAAKSSIKNETKRRCLPPKAIEGLEPSRFSRRNSPGRPPHRTPPAFHASSAGNRLCSADSP